MTMPDPTEPRTNSRIRIAAAFSFFVMWAVTPVVAQTAKPVITENGIAISSTVWLTSIIVSAGFVGSLVWAASQYKSATEARIAKLEDQQSAMSKAVADLTSDIQKLSNSSGNP